LVLDLDRIFQLLNPPGFYTSWLPPRQGKPWQKDLSQQQQEMSQQIQARGVPGWKGQQVMEV
jgi:hypothetical protein